MCCYGYVRVSSKSQNVDRQVAAMEEFGVKREHMFIDWKSGKNFDRPAYKQMLETLEPGDVLVIKSIDRLGRQYEETIDQWRLITHKLKVNIVVLDMPMLVDLMKLETIGKLLCDLILYVLSYLAQSEREAICQRQQEGIRLAKKRGVKFGRRSRVRPDKFAELRDKWRQGHISANRAAKQLKISCTTFLKWAREGAAQRAASGSP